MPLRLGILLTSLGGAIGAVARYAVQQAWPSHGSAFPWTTFAINVVGSGLLALLAVLPAVRARPALPVFLGTGVLGGFTTMSAASVDTFRLLDDGAVGTGLAYAAGTLLGALALVAAISRLEPDGKSALEPEAGDR
jgi:CrcB protein